jgi:putative protein kinase ArgK-like GTPase of G3E family
VCNETVNWKHVASTLLESLKTHYYRDGNPVTVIGSEGVHRGRLLGNTITVQNEDQDPSETRE